MIDLKSFIKNAGLIVFFLCLVVYAVWRSNTAIFGIKIQTNSISDGSRLDTSLITLSGNAEKAIRFSVDGREVLLDNQGNFSLPLLLSPGYSIILLEAEDRFGRVKNKTLHVFSNYQSPSSNKQISSNIPGV